MNVYAERESITMASSDMFLRFSLLRSNDNRFVSVPTEQRLLPRNPRIIK